MKRRVAAIMEAVAWPGEWLRGWLLPGLVTLGVTLSAGPRAGLWQLVASLITPVATATKHLINRPRPPLGFISRVVGRSRGPSFPSSHVATYVGTLGFAVWAVRHDRSRGAILGRLVGLALIALIGPSRVHTGNHRWSDVLGGYALGAVWLAAVVRGAGAGQAGLHE